MQRLILGKEFAIKLVICFIMTSENVSHQSDSFVLVAPFTADQLQAGQSSSQEACQAVSRPNFPDGNVLPGTGFRSLDLTDEDREIINRIDDMIVKQPYSQTSPPLAAVQTE